MTEDNNNIFKVTTPDQLDWDFCTLCGEGFEVMDRVIWKGDELYHVNCLIGINDE